MKAESKGVYVLDWSILDGGILNRFEQFNKVKGDPDRERRGCVIFCERVFIDTLFVCLEDDVCDSSFSSISSVSTKSGNASFRECFWAERRLLVGDDFDDGGFIGAKLKAFTTSVLERNFFPSGLTNMCCEGV